MYFESPMSVPISSVVLRACDEARPGSIPAPPSAAAPPPQRRKSRRSNEASEERVMDPSRLRSGRRHEFAGPGTGSSEHGVASGDVTDGGATRAITRVARLRIKRMIDDAHVPAPPGVLMKLAA